MARRSRGGKFLLVAAVVVAALATLPSPPSGADGNEASGAPAGYRTITAGEDHLCAILDNGGVKCWGKNGRGQLGLGNLSTKGDTPTEMGDNLPFVDLGTGRTAVAVSAGKYFTCALLDNGTVKCWGQNDWAQLGLGVAATLGGGDHRGDAPGEMGDNLPAVDLGTGRTALAITAGDRHVCALLDDHQVKCWGDDTQGQTGFSGGDIVGNSPTEMGDGLPEVALGTGRSATAIVAGGSHTCALLDDATVKCWGDGQFGQTGQGDTNDREAPSEMGDNLPPVDLGTGRTATVVAAGRTSTCAVLDNGSVKCWGRNVSGVLGLGEATSVRRGDAPGEMGDNLPAVDLGSGRTAKAISIGDSHVCTILDNDRVKCWGRPLEGQVGLEDEVTRGDGPNEMGDNLPFVALGNGLTATALTTGTYTSCARLLDGSLKCWGQGPLGVGDSFDRGDAVNEMGSFLPPILLTNPAGVTGTVTDAGTGARIGGVMIALLDADDLTLAGGGVADANGDFLIAVDPGTYFLYLVDRTATHAEGFHGAPTSVVVAPGTATDVDPTMTSTRGSIAGTITEIGTGTPIAGAVAVELNGATAQPQTGALTNGSGAFTLPQLRTGNHLVLAVDPTGTHSPQYVPGTSSPSAATPVSVTPGGTTPANVSLPTQTAPPGGLAITGTVHDASVGSNLANVMVVALRANDLSFAMAAITAPNGAYSLNLGAGSYKLGFVDLSGTHAMQWHSGQPYNELGDATPVSAPTVVNADLPRIKGSVVGTITGTGGEPIFGAWVLVLGPAGIVGGDVTNEHGGYGVNGVPAGDYRATVVDPTGNHVQQYFDGGATYSDATIFAVEGDGITPLNEDLPLAP